MYIVTASVGRRDLGVVGKYRDLPALERQVTDWLLDWPKGECVVYEDGEPEPLAIWSRA